MIWTAFKKSQKSEIVSVKDKIYFWTIIATSATVYNINRRQ